MMKKAFDCVEMKDRIQRRLMREMAGKSTAERHAEIRDTLLRSRSPIGELWRVLEERSIDHGARVAETSAHYGHTR
jgi:non-homologous end joining protein Ku